MKDLRDPIELGEHLLSIRKTKPAESFHLLVDLACIRISDYANSQGPIEKYGDPTKLPSTMP